MSKRNIVKNRAPAPIQISAEQIVREAADRQQEQFVEPIVKVHDQEEYREHLGDRRKHFEDNIRYRREHIGNWVKYAKFEEENSEFTRARSIFERALEVEHRSAELWLRYVEFELRNEFINHARNVLDRAVQLMPRVDFLWYKYVWMEETSGNIAKCRTVFERWMEWKPDESAYLAYCKFEQRHRGEVEKILQQFITVHSTPKSYIKFAKFAEFDLGNIRLARTIFETGLQNLDPDPRLLQQFARFEERQNELERARVIYKHGVSLFGIDQKDDEDEDAAFQKQKDSFYQSYLDFEKKHGDKQQMELLVIKEQRTRYGQRLEKDPFDYDGWLELAKLEGTNDANVRDVYERAIANVPPTKVKDDWRRYIYLWINYAVFEELTARDLDRAVKVYETCLKVIPHDSFSFSKVWIYLSQLHVRRKDLVSARKLLGRAIGQVGKPKLYEHYINLELALGEIDRCRKLYQKYLTTMPDNGSAWNKFAILEQSVGETERARAVFELAVSQELLNQPEAVWKAYIDFEISEGETEKVRQLYDRLLEQTGHVKVWISYAQYEGTTDISKAREIFENAYQQLKEGPDGGKEDRVLLLDAWRVLEMDKGDAESIEAVEAKLPRRIKRKRQLDNEAWEEYFDYQFPDDEEQASNFKILEMAAKWKEQQQQEEDSSDDSDSD